MHVSDEIKIKILPHLDLHFLLYNLLLLKTITVLGLKSVFEHVVVIIKNVIKA